jgi:hypothetical protein
VLPQEHAKVGLAAQCNQVSLLVFGTKSNTKKLFGFVIKFYLSLPDHFGPLVRLKVVDCALSTDLSSLANCKELFARRDRYKVNALCPLRPWDEGLVSLFWVVDDHVVSCYIE